MIACVYALFGSLASLKIISLVASGILSTFFSTDSYHALKVSLYHREKTEVSSLKDFSKNPYTFTCVNVVYRASFLNCLLINLK